MCFFCQIYSRHHLPKIFASVLVHFGMKKKEGLIELNLIGKEVKMKHQSMVYMSYYRVICKC